MPFEVTEVIEHGLFGSVGILLFDRTHDRYVLPHGTLTHRSVEVQVMDRLGDVMQCLHKGRRDPVSGRLADQRVETHIQFGHLGIVVRQLLLLVDDVTQLRGLVRSAVLGGPANNTSSIRRNSAASR